MIYVYAGFMVGTRWSTRTARMTVNLMRFLTPAANALTYRAIAL